MDFFVHEIEDLEFRKLYSIPNPIRNPIMLFGILANYYILYLNEYGLV